MTDKSQEIKEVVQNLVKIRISKAVREFTSEMLDNLEFSEEIEDSILQQSRLNELIRQKLSEVYRMGAQDGNYTIAFLIAQ